MKQERVEISTELAVEHCFNEGAPDSPALCIVEPAHDGYAEGMPMMFYDCTFTSGLSFGLTNTGERMSRQETTEKLETIVHEIRATDPQLAQALLCVLGAAVSGGNALERLNQIMGAFSQGELQRLKAMLPGQN